MKFKWGRRGFSNLHLVVSLFTILGLYESCDYGVVIMQIMECNGDE